MTQFETLALFPLHTVLFPGEMLPLHIFEERYKAMIGRCLTRQEPFGVVLIHSGLEVGLAAQPYSIGTTATIVEALRFDDGRILIAAQGGPRFRIHEMIEESPYFVAAVEFLEDSVDLQDQLLADRVRALYDRYRRSPLIQGSAAQPLADLPLDALDLSFHLSDQLQITHTGKQRLLEAELPARLAALAAVLEDELRLLPPSSDAPTQHPDGPWSLN